eukprot:2609953-Pleurochrysis_carterae.AAC.1
MERKLTATVAEQDRREQVAAELKALRDQDLRNSTAKPYCAGKQQKQTQEELGGAWPCTEAHLSQAQTDKGAADAAAAGSAAPSEQLSDVSKLYALLQIFNVELKKELYKVRAELTADKEKAAADSGDSVGGY